MSIADSTLINDADKQMIQKAMTKLICPGAVKKHLIKVGARLDTKKIDQIWAQVLVDFRNTPERKISNPGNYQDFYNNWGAFGLYLNLICN